MKESFLNDKHMSIGEKKYRLANALSEMYRLVNELRDIERIIFIFEMEILPLFQEMQGICYKHLSEQEEKEEKKKNQ